jgi:hypothetical protein
MNQDQINEDVLDSLVGHAISTYEPGDGGMHFTLDDGRVVAFTGTFIVAVFLPEDTHAFH